MLEICCTFKDEEENLLEWVAYHYVIGINKIVMFNDGSTDRFREELSIVPKGFIDIRDAVEKKVHSSKQIEIYNHYATEKKREAYQAWSIFLDIDEYLVSSVPINQVISLIPSGINQVRLSWMNFGSRATVTREPGLIIERFTECDPNHQKCRISKSLVRPNKIIYADVHFSQVNGCTTAADFHTVCLGSDFFSPKIHSCLYVAHYPIKSLEEFKRKVERGYNTAHPQVPLDYYSEMNTKGSFVNDAARVAPFVRMQIERWRKEYVESR
jgi:hypothetical protein